MPDNNKLKEEIINIGNAWGKEKEGKLYRYILEAIEKPLIEHVLEEAGGNQLKASKILGMNRNTIRTKIKKLGINAQMYRNH